MGVINAAQAIGMKKPIVIRLKGTNVEAANKLIEGSGFSMIVEDDFEKAATKVVKMTEIIELGESCGLEVSAVSK
mgnify:CR=1 FL=1